MRADAVLSGDAWLMLDANASVPPSAAARQAAEAALRVLGNPSSTHGLGRLARRTLDGARDAVARALGGDARHVVFTSGASEGNRLLVDALVHARTQSGPLCVLMGALEHPSMRKPLEAAAARGELVLRRLPADERSAADADFSGVDVLVCTAAHNETGIIPDLPGLIARLPDDALVCVDAAQACARMGPLPERVDAIVVSSHKVGGYAGAGAVLWRGHARSLAPPWSGGGQEGGLRPGTEPLVALAAFGAACAEVDHSRASHAELAPLRDRLESTLAGLWGAQVVGATRVRLPNTTALAVPGVDADALRIALDRTGVCVGFGAACAALAPEPSPGLAALGLDERLSRATVRLSLAPGTTPADIDAALARIAGVVPTLRARRHARGVD